MKTVSCLLLGAAAIQACDNPFAYSYLAETLKPGRTEMVQWATARLGRDLGSGYVARYRGLDFKTEIERGISESEQVSFYVNYRYLETPGLDGLRFDGFQVSYKRMLADPDREAWGQAVYIEPGYSQSSSKNGALRDEYSLELKYIAQRNLGADDGWVYAANVVAEAERKPATDDDAVKLRLTQGLACQLSVAWLAGVEVVAEAEWAEMNDFEYGAVLAGPCVRHQSEGGFFVTLAALAQVAGSPADKGDLNVTDKSPWEVRLKAGVEF